MRLRELRKNRGLRQKDIAETIGVSPQSYGYYENGVNKPDPEMLIKLADFFQCSTDYLLGREDDIGNIVIQNETAAPQLSESEQKLLNSFRRLPSGLQDRVLAYVDGLDDAIHPKDKKNFG